VSDQCRGLATGEPTRFPVKTKKADRPHRRGVAYVVFDDHGRVAVETRPDKGLLGGMLGLPTSDWAADEPSGPPPVPADWRTAGAVEHVFTHFSLTLTVMTARVDAEGPYRWMPIEAARAALPTVFAKALDRASAPDLFG
jgi:A/G-specific adenine glycosylase